MSHGINTIVQPVDSVRMAAEVDQYFQQICTGLRYYASICQDVSVRTQVEHELENPQLQAYALQHLLVTCYRLGVDLEIVLEYGRNHTPKE